MKIERMKMEDGYGMWRRIMAHRPDWDQLGWPIYLATNHVSIMRSLLFWR